MRCAKVYTQSDRRGGEESLEFLKSFAQLYHSVLVILNVLYCFTSRRLRLYYCTCLVFPNVLFLHKLATVCTVVLVAYNNIPVSYFYPQLQYLKFYLEIIIWKCYLVREFQCVVTVSVSVCMCVSLPATVYWRIPFLSL